MQIVSYFYLLWVSGIFVLYKITSAKAWLYVHVLGSINKISYFFNSVLFKKEVHFSISLFQTATGSIIEKGSKEKICF